MMPPGTPPTFKEVSALARRHLISRDPRVTAKTCFTLDEFRAWLRSEQVKLDLWRCRYCAEYLTISGVRVDHWAPLGLGGVTALSNFVPACARCNTIKGKIGGSEFIQLLEVLKMWPAAMRDDLTSRLAAGPQWRGGGGRRGKSTAQAILDGARERGLLDKVDGRAGVR